jgi:hypothetical protein
MKKTSPKWLDRFAAGGYSSGVRNAAAGNGRRKTDAIEHPAYWQQKE